MHTMYIIYLHVVLTCFHGNLLKCKCSINDIDVNDYYHYCYFIAVSDKKWDLIRF